MYRNMQAFWHVTLIKINYYYYYYCILQNCIFLFFLVGLETKPANKKQHINAFSAFEKKRLPEIPPLL